MALFKNKAYVGVDLGHHRIKVMQLQRLTDGWHITRFGVAPTPPNSMRDGVVIEQTTIAAALKKLLKDSGIVATNAHIAVAGGSVVVRNVRIPKMPEATLRKSIKFEASRYVPSTVEDSYIEFEIVGDAEDNQMEVIVVAAPKDIVESRMRACEAAGLEIESVDTEAFAMYRSLIESDGSRNWNEETLAIVDIGSSGSHLSVINKGHFMMTRAIPQGGDSLTEALKNYFKLSDEDAEAGKLQLNVAELLSEQPVENPPLRVIQSHLDDLIREIRRSLNYYQSQQTEKEQGEDRQVKLLVLTGGGSKMQGLARYVEHKLGIKSMELGVLSNKRMTFGGSLPDDGPDLAVASGLAMRAFAHAA